MREFGNSASFSIGFELRPDPDGLDVSWGALEIWVAGRCLTRGYSKDGDHLPEVEISLAPVLRWVLESWDALFHEERLPVPTRHSRSSIDWYLHVLREELPGYELLELVKLREQWWQRHGLGSAAPGFRIPDIHFRRFGQRIEISWSDVEWHTCGPGAQMLEEPGAALVELDAVTGSLAEWCAALVDELEARAPAETQWSELHALLYDLRSPARQLSRLSFAARGWLDAAVEQFRKRAGVTDGDPEATKRALLGARPSSGGLYELLPVPALLFRSAGPRLDASDVQQLLDLCSAPTLAGRLPELQSYAPPPVTPMDVTKDGYDRALDFRGTWEIPPDAPLSGALDLETEILPRLGITIADVLLGDRGTDGAAVFGEGIQATIAVNRHGRFARTRNGRRMTLAHELCHLLHDVEYGRVGIVSGPWAPMVLERRANAFAAMLLAPQPVLEAHLPSDVESWSRADLMRAMEQIGVGVTTLTWQLCNLGWISESERRAWVDELTQ